MDGFYVFLAILSIVISLIVLIKYFILCSDVKEIKSVLTSHVEPNFHFLVHNGYQDEAKRVLVKTIWNSKEMSKMRVAQSLKVFDENYRVLKNGYEEFFNVLGEDFPLYESLRSQVKEK